MEYKVEEIFFKSSNGKSKIYAKILSPIDSRKIKGIIQFSHGMCEYFDKYIEFHKYMLSKGYVVCGHDHIGHGSSIKNESDKGFFAEKDGYKYLIEDLKKMTDIVRERYPYEPLFLLGHSMGSLIARNYAAKYGKNIRALLLCGTVGPQPLVDSAINLANVIIKQKGERYRSRLLYKLAIDFANASFKPHINKFDWTTSDEVESTINVNDEKQNFLFTSSGYKDLFKLVKFANSERVIKTIPKELPIYLFSGKEDPVGEKGAGIKRVAKLYKEQKIKNVSVKLYDNCRHEMLREKNRKEVFKDILDYIDIIRFGDE